MHSVKWSSLINNKIEPSTSFIIESISLALREEQHIVKVMNAFFLI